MKNNSVMDINHLEKVTINNSGQWLLVRGKNASAPLIIHIQAGPGLPIIPEANKMQKLLRLEDDYIVAYWDQRACGKSYHKNIDPATINFSQLADDIIACTKYLLEKYKKEKAIIVGYSIGATIGLMAASKESTLFSHLFLVGVDIDIPMANKHSLEFAMVKAKEKNSDKLLKQTVDLCKASIPNAQQFQKRARLLTDLGGILTGYSYNRLLIETIINILLCKGYNLNDILKTTKGMEFCQNALLPELGALNLFDKIKTIGVPVHFIQGKHDGVAPYQIAFKYYEYIQAENKTFTCFENSAHFPQYEEPEKFAKLLKETI